MPKGFTTFGQLKVRKAGTDEPPLIITCIEPEILGEIEAKAMAEGFEIVDSSPGYKLFRDVEDAMDSIRMFCR